MEKITFESVVIPRSQRRVMMYRGREYHIFISTPVEPPPPSGFPVIYLLDANSVFGTMTEAIRAQSRFPERTGVYPAIVVGIGYDTEMPFHPSRHYDFTLPVPRSQLPPSPDGKEWPEQGGAKAFLTFIEEVLKPTIARDFPVDASKQTLFGHSLGGLFVLFALFTQPYGFHNYIAGSPSIIWNEQKLLEKERLLAGLLQDNRQIRLLLAAGELEHTHASLVNAKAQALAERMSAIGNDGLAVEYREFANESHISVLPVLISHAIRFASSTNA
ncbi:Ferri-bacillibactin esterase BesA [Paenibacillus solanacearum]|uniref:Ferri-bacillibactin esterase BesA n=1 Tax=Paenibacillus solanacearum TaxID=2048548 RepID=A0A916K7Q8_9BACL|nr:alpha/beta hydrolase-fold protein [Paenibacillus solanacearum]CAG7641336.1 Ferri-bacillibactin esterase BesA [Paenibacillus solanacearum]